MVTGKVGKDVSVQQGYDAARLIGINLLTTMKKATGGDLDKVKRVVKLVGFVQCEGNCVVFFFNVVLIFY